MSVPQTIGCAARRPELLSDDDLMRRVQGDDIQAFAQLHKRYARRVFGFARVMCDTSERAEDVVQEAFLSLWTTRRSYETRGALQAWLFALTRHRAIDIQRSHRRGDSLRASDGHLHTVPAPGSIEDDTIQRDEHARQRTQLCAALVRLPDEQREAIELAHFAHLTHTEIAERLRLPLGTVKGRIRLGYAKAHADFERPTPSVSASSSNVTLASSGRGRTREQTRSRRCDDREDLRENGDHDHGA